MSVTSDILFDKRKCMGDKKIRINIFKKKKSCKCCVLCSFKLINLMLRTPFSTMLTFVDTYFSVTEENAYCFGPHLTLVVAQCTVLLNSAKS